jgi:hypothetical protein
MYKFLNMFYMDLNPVLDQIRNRSETGPDQQHRKVQ